MCIDTGLETALSCSHLALEVTYFATSPSWTDSRLGSLCQANPCFACCIPDALNLLGLLLVLSLLSI